MGPSPGSRSRFPTRKTSDADLALQPSTAPANGKPIGWCDPSHQATEVARLFDPSGYLWAGDSVAALNLKDAKPKREIRAPVERATLSEFIPRIGQSHGRVFSKTKLFVRVYVNIDTNMNCPFWPSLPTLSAGFISGFREGRDFGVWD